MLPQGHHCYILLCAFRTDMAWGLHDLIVFPSLALCFDEHLAFCGIDLDVLFAYARHFSRNIKFIFLFIDY